MTVVAPIEDVPAAAAPSESEAVTIAARALCGLYGRKGCLCRGDRVRCHAVSLWAEEAAAVVRALHKAGMLRRDGEQER